MAEMTECPDCRARLAATDGVCSKCRNNGKNSETAKANCPKLMEGSVAEVAERIEQERRVAPQKLVRMGLVLVIGGVSFAVIWGYLPAVFWMPIWIVATLATTLGVVSLVSGLVLFVSDRFWPPRRARRG